jgi:hypothetical protein
MGMRKGKFVFLFLFIFSCLAYFYSSHSKKQTTIQNEKPNQALSRVIAAEQQKPQVQVPTTTTDSSAWSRKISIQPKLNPVLPTANPQDLTEFIFNQPQTSWKIWNRMKALGPNGGGPSSSINVSQFQIQADPISNHSLENFSLQEPVVLFEERLKKAGILTGTFEIQLKNSRQWEAFEKLHSLRLIQSFQELNLFYATANQDRFNLSQLYQDLSQDPSVALVNLEILSKQYEQN